MLLGERIEAMWVLFGCYLLLTVAICSAAASAIMLKPAAAATHGAPPHAAAAGSAVATGLRPEQEALRASRFRSFF